MYGCWFELDRLDCREAVRRILERADVLVAHNLKFDAHKLETAGIVGPDFWAAKELHDTECMSHLLDEHRPKGLKSLMVSVLGWADTVTVEKHRANPEYTGRGCGVPRMLPYTVEEPAEAYHIKQAREHIKKERKLQTLEEVSYDMIPRGTIVPYAIDDAVGTYQLARLLYPKIVASSDLAALYAQEMELTSIIMGMERAGMKVDTAYVGDQVVRYRRQVMAHEGLIEGIVGKEVRTGPMTAKERPNYWNPSSKDDIREFFTGVEGHTRPSYSKDVLATIPHVLAEELLDYRSDSKILGTYLEPLAAETGPDGIFHMSVRQHGTVAGRTSNGAERGDQ